VGSTTSTLTGTHPDLLLFEDIVFSNSQSDLDTSERAFVEAFALLPPHGRVIINGTRWDDKDLYGKILEGGYSGNLGPFRSLVLSCYTEDRKPIYPKKVRGGAESGFSLDDLERRRKINPTFFYCQFLNDPQPEEFQTMKVMDIQTYHPQDLPDHGKAYAVGIEIVGGGVTFPTLFQRTCREFRLEIPVKEINPKKSTGKDDRILNALAPIIAQKRLFVQQWMKEDRHGIVHEVRRFGAGANDDIIDALAMVHLDMCRGIHPQANQLSQLWIAADLAFRIGADKDWTVFIAVTIDHKDNYWVKDYERFQEQDPVKIAERLVKFYQRMNSDASETRYNRRERSRLISSYN
jgi:hypothetical protein